MNLRLLFILLAAVLLTGCGADTSPEAETAVAGRDRPLVVVSNFPLYYFTRKIAGDSAEVVFPSIQGDPANWKPDSESIELMQSADLVILNGAAYESWLSWVSLPPDVLFDSSASISEQLLPLAEETVHQHGPGGEHSHTGLAFTIWLDPVLAAGQARAIETALSTLLPQNRDTYLARLSTLETDLAKLDNSLEIAFEEIGDQAIIFSHPVYQYLAARYGLNGVSMHWESEDDPGIKAWIEFQEILHHHPAKLMIWEDQPVEATGNQLGQLGVQPVVFHTASNLPDGGDYFDVMYANIKRLSSD